MLVVVVVQADLVLTMQVREDSVAAVVEETTVKTVILADLHQVVVVVVVRAAHPALDTAVMVVQE
jgi:hypothetical protein